MMRCDCNFFIFLHIVLSELVQQFTLFVYLNVRAVGLFSQICCRLKIIEYIPEVKSDTNLVLDDRYGRVKQRRKEKSRTMHNRDIE